MTPLCWSWALPEYRLRKSQGNTTAGLWCVLLESFLTHALSQGCPGWLPVAHGCCVSRGELPGAGLATGRTLEHSSKANCAATSWIRPRMRGRLPLWGSSHVGLLQLKGPGRESPSHGGTGSFTQGWNKRWVQYNSQWQSMWEDHEEWLTEPQQWGNTKGRYKADEPTGCRGT